ncbi:MAG: hypothetical protein IIX19_04415, partial [Alistipes sp.]|nr:hypothetical protein [Alistipes sp.]
MHRRVIAYIALLLITFTVVGCNVTRNLPEGQYLVSKVKFQEDETTPRDERITVDKDGIDVYVRQSPNKRFLGIDFYVWVYEHANPEKDNWWNNFKRKIGEEPVLLDMELTEKSITNLETYLRTKGYFHSDVTYDIDTTRRARRAEITYNIRQGEPTRIENLRYRFRDSSLRSVILADSSGCLLKRGDNLDITLLDAERERIAAYLNDRGYFDFTVNNISYEVDTLGHPYSADVRLIVRPTLTGYNERGEPQWEDNAIYRIRNINVYPTYDPMLRSTTGFRTDANIDTTYSGGLNIIRDLNLKPQLRNSILRHTIAIYPNYIYDSNQVSHTYKELMSLGFFRTAKIDFTRVADEESYATYLKVNDDGTTELLDMRERFLDCNIYG